jgi:uncharacterized membrane-anchored protein YitT (DUF2179 family)
MPVFCYYTGMRDLSAPLRAVKQLFLVTLASALMAFNINTFVKAGGIIPGGFTGLTLLIQEICQ